MQIRRRYVRYHSDIYRNVIEKVVKEELLIVLLGMFFSFIIEAFGRNENVVTKSASARNNLDHHQLFRMTSNKRGYERHWHEQNNEYAHDSD